MPRPRGRFGALVIVTAGLLLRGGGFSFLQAFHGKLLGPRRSDRGRCSHIACRQQDLRSTLEAVEIQDIANSRADKYQLLSQREHVLHRPDMYIGPVEPREETAWVLNGSNKIVENSLLISPGLVQIFNEILVNAIDRQFQSGMSEIRVDVNAKAGRISISNDGGPIPIEKHESGHYVPTLVFGEFLSGDNFNDTKVRFTGGRNGVGAKATNAFSRSFEVQVDDPGTGIRFFQRWEKNMLRRLPAEQRKLPKSVKQGSVAVSFEPDLSRFSLKKIDKDHLRIMKARAFDAAACTKAGITVYFNGKALPTQDFQEYSQRVLGKDLAVTKIIDAKGNVRAEVAAGFAGEQGFAALGFVNGMRCSRGTHVNYAVQQLATGIADMAPTGLSRPSAATVKQYFRVVVKVLVDNPDFDSQTKTKLTTTTSKLGFDFVIPADFVGEVARLGVLQAAIRATQAAHQRVMQQVLGSGTAPSVAKLEDATYAGKVGKECTLILTEGDSAKALAVAGLAKIGRERYGVFPLKGKPLNVRSATDKQIQGNEEIKNLMHIIGLEWGQTFDSEEQVEALRYQKVMIFSDQDLDGHHIAGLLVNLFVAKWPSLLEVKPDFIQRFATPLVKVSPRTKASAKLPAKEFFTQGEFESWQRSEGTDWTRRYGAKYYKGLGTSTREEALAYFANMDRHVMDFNYEGQRDEAMVEKVFEPDRANDRKDWLREYSADAELDYTKSQASFSDFLNLQMVHFSIYDCVRSIPLLLDGLKPSQRKVLHWALKHSKSGEKKVSQIVGLVSSATGYHHGEESLVKVIVHLAQDFVGTNNINLLEPIGMFGTRLNGRDVHASARYIHTKLTTLVRKIFLDEDLDLLPPQQEDGQSVEPRSMLPILPLVLINGFQGIGTGWATQGPNFDPLEVVDRLEQIIRGEPVSSLSPSYRNFHGEVIQQNGRFYSLGAWTVLSLGSGSPDTVEITELPVGVWTHDFIETVEAKAKAKNVMLKVHKCQDHDDQHVHLLIGFEPGQLLKGGAVDQATSKIEQLLGLRKRLPSQMWLYQIPELAAGRADARLEYFEDANEILQAFYRARMPFYELRKEKMQRKMAEKVRRLSNQVRCIRMCQDDTLSFSELCARGLEEQGFESIGLPSSAESEDSEDADDPGQGFEYILKMPIRRFSDAEAAKMEAQLASAEEELERLQALEPREMWLEDLSIFRHAYTEVTHQVAKQSSQKEHTLSDADRKKAAQAFDQERKRLKSRRHREQKEVWSPAVLKKMAMAMLQERCRSHGLVCSGKSKKELVDALLRYFSAGFTSKEWSKLSVDDLKVHLASRKLSAAGRKQDLVFRLSEAPLPVVEFGLSSTKEMKQWLRDFGLPAGGKASALDVADRYMTVKGRVFEEESSIRKLGQEALRDLVPEEAKADPDDLKESLGKCHALARSEDLGKVIKNRLSNKEHCWVECIRAAREDLEIEGFAPMSLDTELFQQMQKCFAEECARLRF